MHGDGTNPDTTTNNALPPARLIDLTRLASRAGRMLTGVDRVELAYVRELTAQDIPCFGLARTSLGFVLLRPGTVHQVVDRIITGNMRKAGFLSRFSNGLTGPQRQAETELRAWALARGRPYQFERMLRRHLPPGFEYFNVGHSNLEADTFRAMRLARGATNVLVHDVIPLDFPDFQRPGTPKRFEAKMRVVSEFADRVIYNSKDTQARTEQRFSDFGRVPSSIVAYLGTDEGTPVLGKLPDGLPPKKPYFVVLGTIEPRKNHAFLLDLWEEMGDEAPYLLICGTRGWNNKPVFDRLDALPEHTPIKELRGLTDEAVSSLLAQANGLLFPSFAEGFGLPAVEALRLGCPVICNDLPVFREILANKVVYADVNDGYLWINEVMRLVSKPAEKVDASGLEHLSWERHFKNVLSTT